MDTEPIISHVILLPDAYLVPRGNGSLVVGATVEEQGFDTHLTAGGVFELLRGAWEALPGIYEFPIVDTFASLRPASRDNAPILGLTSRGWVNFGRWSFSKRYSTYTGYL